MTKTTCFTKTAFGHLILSLFLLGSMAISTMAYASDNDNFLEPDKAFVFSAQMLDSHTVNVHYRIAPQYYMYHEHFVIKSSAKQSLGKIDFVQKPIIKYDATFAKNMPIYHEQVDIRIALLDGQNQNFTLSVTGQGCADAGLCYPPETKTLNITPTQDGYQLVPEKQSLLESLITKPTISTNKILNTIDTASSSSPGSTTGLNPPQLSVEAKQSLKTLNQANDTSIAAWLEQASLLKMILICFALGVLLSFTPCVLPMLPILLAIIIGQSNRPHSKTRSMGLSISYVFGTSIIYTLLGIAAASIGAVMAQWIQNPWVIGFFALALCLLALAMFGLYTIQMPSGIQNQLNNRLNKLPGGKYSASFVMGMLSALICGPCLAAPLAGVLLFISQSANLTLGAIALFALAWGQGISLLLLGLSASLLPKMGAWMESVKNLCGLLLLATALLMSMPILPVWLSMLAWAFLALLLALFLPTFRFNKQQNILAYLGQALGLLATIWAILLLVGLATGQQDVLHPLKGFSTKQTSDNSNSPEVAFKRISNLAQLNQIVQSSQQPVMLDFYADWCLSCKEMEKFTFSDPKVKALLANLLLLQVDVTQNNENDRELLKRFKLFGPPGIIFFDQHGNELAQRVIGFQNAQTFTQSLGKVQ